MAQLHATPYGYYENFTGFYFTDLAEFQAKFDHFEKLHGCEEYEIQFVEGDSRECKLAELCKVHQGNLDVYFDALDVIDTDEKLVAMVYLMQDCGRSYEDALDVYKDVQLFEGSVKDYAYDLVAECYFTAETPEIFKLYFDYDSFAKDLELGGDVSTVEYDGTHYVVTNANNV